MLFRNIAVYTFGLSLPFVNGRSVFDWGQDILSDGNINIPQTITVSTETKVSRLPELASVELFVTASAPTEDEALGQAVVAARNVADILSDIESQPDSPIASWLAYRPRVLSVSYGANYDGFYDFDRVGIIHTHDCLDCGESTGNQKAGVRFTVRFRNVEAVDAFKRNITSSSASNPEDGSGPCGPWEVRVASISWDLTTASMAELKRELRTEAMSDAMAAGRDYAEVFGKSSVRPLECEESYTYVGEKYDWHLEDMGVVDTEPREIQGSTTMKCKFSTA